MSKISKIVDDSEGDLEKFAIAAIFIAILIARISPRGILINILAIIILSALAVYVFNYIDSLTY